MDECTCGHSRYTHRHAEEKEVGNPDAQLRANCLMCECEQFTEMPQNEDEFEELFKED